MDFFEGRVPEADIRRFNFLAGAVPIEMAKQMRDAAFKTVTRFRQVFVRVRMSGRPGLNRITGDLIRSFRVGRSPRGTDLDDVVSWLASRSRYAAIHEFGGVIRPKRRRMLAIPLKAAKTEAGAVKGEAVRVAPTSATFGTTKIRKGERTLYARKDLIFIKRLGGKSPLLVKKFGEGKNARILPMYVLKASVTIPPRLQFFDTFTTWVRKPAALRFFLRALDRVWDKFKTKGFQAPGGGFIG